MKLKKPSYSKELNLDLGRLTIRIASCQFAIWWDFNDIINLQW